jgi:hypothetical protein
LANEKTYIHGYVKQLDEHLDKKIREKQEELNSWDRKMQKLVEAEPLN